MKHMTTVWYIKQIPILLGMVDNHNISNIRTYSKFSRTFSPSTFCFSQKYISTILTNLQYVNNHKTQTTTPEPLRKQLKRLHNLLENSFIEKEKMKLWNQGGWGRKTKRRGTSCISVAVYKALWTDFKRTSRDHTLESEIEEMNRGFKPWTKHEENQL